MQLSEYGFFYAAHCLTVSHHIPSFFLFCDSEPPWFSSDHRLKTCTVLSPDPRKSCQMIHWRGGYPMGKTLSNPTLNNMIVVNFHLHYDSQRALLSPRQAGLPEHCSSLGAWLDRGLTHLVTKSRIQRARLFMDTRDASPQHPCKMGNTM